MPLTDKSFTNTTIDGFGINSISGGTRRVYWRFHPNGETYSVDLGLQIMESYGAVIYFPLSQSQTVDLGYIDMPAIPDGATISITAQVTPTIAAKWWTKNQSDVAAAFDAVSSNLAALDARVAALESANAKTLVLEKPDTVKETAEALEEIEEQEEQEEMPLEDAEE